MLLATGRDQAGPLEFNDIAGDRSRSFHCVSKQRFRRLQAAEPGWESGGLFNGLSASRRRVTSVQHVEDLLERLFCKHNVVRQTSPLFRAEVSRSSRMYRTDSGLNSAAICRSRDIPALETLRVCTEDLAVPKS